jgi:hypothetical protein
MIRLLTNLGRGCLYRFAPNDKNPKNLNKFLKMKKNEQTAETNEEVEVEKEAPHYAHRILYLQYAPLVILALPTIYFIQDITDPFFLQSVNLLQYYTSGLLCFNSFFTQGRPYLKQKKPSIFTPSLWVSQLLTASPAHSA